MAFGWNKRRMRKAWHRVRHLPRGLDLFRYGGNKVRAAWLRARGSTRVAHPSSIMLEVTNHCNLKCITCPREYQYGEEMAKGFMPIDRLRQVVDEVYPYVDSIGLTGLGETLMYKQLEEAVAYIRGKSPGIITFISINAHLPKCVEIAGRLADHLDTIQISMDGVGDVYEQVRLRSDYNTFYDNVKAICEVARGKRAEVMFNFVAVKENYHTMAEVVEAAADLGVDFVNVTPFNVASVTAHDVSYYDFFRTEAFKREVVRAKEAADRRGNVTLTIWDVKTPPGFRKCHLPWSHFYISWDGWMTPCCAKPFPKELNFGNVFEEGLMTCLNKPEYRQFRQMWYDNETPEFCRKCHMVDMPAVELPVELPMN
jgi:radical SAM protein with 4Fe4S-binding SPASM domain